MNVRTIISLALFFMVAAGIGFFLKDHPELIGHVRGISLWSMTLLLLLSVATLAANGYSLRIFARKFDIHLKWTEWFGLATVTAMGNYLSPFSGGMVARAAYLKNRHDFPYAHFLSMLASNYLIAYGVIGVAGVAGMSTLSGTESFSWLLVFFFLAILSAILLVLFLPSASIGSRHRLLRLMQQALAGMKSIELDSVLLWKLVSLTLFNVLVGTCLFIIAFHSIGTAVPFRIALLIYLLTACTVLINITPGNLGVQEAVTSLAAGILGAGADMGLLAALVVRAVTIIAAFALGPFFSYLLSKELIASRAASSSGAEEIP
ncbi:MAG: hypothetical protein A4E73_03959 [Syntrophaceae bacterium PtaU1.Bin231]|jgi:uncharacterized membrane protein YbhN (UPF0104 family)|nr:MAG: hypothetical protein A4E67_02416 [Syntrophaceae bacterium PtaB.Bin038]OPY86451.1 MAG: hypothetical protein A4E73_03959 [Syntrophaceae bacterium PtaU1.Bin231]